MKLVLAFLYYITSLGLFRTLVQVLMNTKLIHFIIYRPVSLLGERVGTVRQIYTFTHAYALGYGEGGRITIKPTIVGHIHLNIIIFSQKLLEWCDDELNITLMVIVCTSKQIKLLNFTNSKGLCFND
jgi:hypothetical protein